MPSAAREIFRLQIEGTQRGEIFRAEACKVIQQLGKGFALAFALLRTAVKCLERLPFATFQDHLRARHPIGELAVNEMADDVECVPSTFSFVLKRPLFRQIAEKGIENGGSAREKRYCMSQVVLHVLLNPRPGIPQSF